MPEREDNIRRLRNMFEDAAQSTDEEEAARLGVSLAEYRRGKDVGIYRKGDGGPRYTGNARLPSFKNEPATPPLMNDQRLRRSQPGRQLRPQSDRPGYRNDT